MSTDVVVALIGIAGVIVGSVFAFAGQFAFHWYQQRPNKLADKKRMNLLTTMLNHPQFTWRTFTRLKHVIGCDDENTKRLLLQVGARASEDGEEKWGLLSRNPFKDEQ